MADKTTGSNMAFNSETGNSGTGNSGTGNSGMGKGQGSSGGGRAASRGVDLTWDSAEDREIKAKRDWKRFFLVLGLGGLSWVATYVGMLELVEANMGELPLIHKLIIGFSVAMLMVMVVWLLDQMFSDIGWFSRLLFGTGYIFLTIISIGFGFGFYWKVLESRSEASRSAESAVGQVQTSLHAAMTRLEQLQGTLDSLTAISTQKSDTERQAGTSCPNSKPGDGPRRKMRDDDANRFKFAADFVKGRVGSVKTDIAELNGDLAKISGDDKSIVDAKSGTRNEFMRSLGRKLDMTVVGFNAFRTDPQLKQIRIDLNERADKVTFVDTKGGTYTCPDGQLTTALKGVVRAIDELPSLEKPKIATVEGSEAVIEAFRRLTATFYGALSFKMPPSPEELRELQKKAVQSAEATPAAQAKLTAMAEQAGLSKRDYVPLAIAMFVDICLLLVSMKKATGRLNGLLPKMRAAERGPVIQILSRFNEIHHDKEIRENFELFRHVVFDFHGAYYAAVPMNAPYRPNLRNGRQGQGYGVSDAEQLIQEAHLLANLFASFEKEKIFTRVYSPLLGTKTIQKRLRRQGSKFANSESFRIYRFKDGAWSDIILGAVMGAARRVETEKRRRRVEEDMFRDDQPSLTPNGRPGELPGLAAQHVDGARAAAAYGRTGQAFGPQPSGGSQGSGGQGMNYPPNYPYIVGGNATAGSRPYPAAASYPAPPFGAPNGYTNGQDTVRRSTSDHIGQQGPAGEPGWIPQPMPRHEPGTASGSAGSASGSGYSMARQPAPWPRPDDSAMADASLRNRFAPHGAEPASQPEAAQSQTSAIAGIPTGENVILHPAMIRPAVGQGTTNQGIASQQQPVQTSDAAPARPPINSAPVEHTHVESAPVETRLGENATISILSPAAHAREPMVKIEAVRETVTYSLPVSEAALPQSLFRTASTVKPEPVMDIQADVVDLITADAQPQPVPARNPALPPPLPVSKPAVETAAVISLPDAAVELAARAERTAWEQARFAGFEGDQIASLDAVAAETDDFRSMAMRLAPEKRES